MNRTKVLLVSAAVLAVIALAAGRSPSAPKVSAGPLAPPAFVPSAPVQPVASGPVTLTAALSSSRVLAGASLVYAKVDVSAASLERQVNRVPVNLAVAIDHSGSMNGGKMNDAKRAASALLDQLVHGDRLAIISFDDRVDVFPSSPINPETKARMRRFIDGIYEAGSTNISDALSASYVQLRPYASEYKVSRVVLLSDGQPTAGLTDTASLVRLAEGARAYRVSTSAFGVGLDFNAGLMRDLASSGGGGYAFIENAANLGLAFAHELGDASQLVARDVKVKIEAPAGVTIEDVAGHAFTRVGNTVIVPTYDFGPGQSAQMLVRLAVNAPSAGSVSLGAVTVSFTDVQGDRALSVSAPLVATATADAADVALGTNPSVMEMAKAVDITTRVQQAQAAYDRGDTQSAFDIMGNTRKLFGMSADALAGSEDEIEGNWRRGGDYARRTDMNLTKKTMKNFGQNNTSSY